MSQAEDAVRMARSATQQPHSRAINRRRYPLWRLIRANFYDFVLLLRESWIVLVGFVIVVLTGTLYLVAYEQKGLAVALYETLKLLTLQSSLDLPSSLLGKLLFFLIPLLGLVLIFQSVLNFGRLVLDKGSRREAWQVSLAATYRDHVIVCGLGRVSLRVVIQLIECGYQPVVIERDWGSEFVERALNLKVPVIKGDARELTTLRQAGMARAHAVVATVNDDLTNIEIALTARSARPELRVILRVFGEELDQNLERGFGANSAFSASALAAPTYVAASVSREIDYVLPLGDQLLGITRLSVQPDSQIAGFVRAIEEQHGIRVLSHYDSTGRHIRRAAANPGSAVGSGGIDLMRQLSSGDDVTLLGSLSALESLRLKNIRGSKLSMLMPRRLEHPTEQYDTVIICGLGKVAYRVIQQLHQLSPRPRIVVVRLSDGRPDFLHRISQLEGVTTIIGDAREPAMLRAAGIERAYSVAALTSDDLLNLQIGLAARRTRADVHIVLRVFSDVLAEKLADMFGIRTIYSTSALAGPALAAAAVLGDITHAFSADGRIFSADQMLVRAGGLLDGRTVDDIRVRHEALIISLRRDGQLQVLPSLSTTLAPGDEVTLLASIEALAGVRATLARDAIERP
ncbi:MAG TPA: NAD-binding protein [Roseiflexaceae bacterium]|nr:NAD-binding protein [Roseiflexaceae bacterium]